MKVLNTMISDLEGSKDFEYWNVEDSLGLVKTSELG